MINQPIGIQNSPYNDFSGYKKNPNFVLNTQTPFNEENEHKGGHTVAISLGVMGLAIGFGLLGLMKSPKYLTKNLDKLKRFLEEQIEHGKNSKSATQLNKFYTYALRKVHSLLLKSESVNNFTSMKDSLFKYGMEKTKFTKKIHSGITNLFQKLSRATVRNSWMNTQQKFVKSFNNLNKIEEQFLKSNGNKVFEINGVKKTGAEWIEEIRQNKISIQQVMDKNSSKSTLAEREAKMEVATTDLDKLIRAQLKHLGNSRLYNTFVADRFIQKSKDQMFLEMFKVRKSISMTPTYKKELVEDFLQRAENVLLDENSDLFLPINGLRKKVSSGNISEKEITEEFSNITKTLSNSKLQGKKKQQSKYYLSIAQEILQDNSRGKMQDMLEIYKHLMPEKLSKVTKELNNSVSALDKSIDKECIKYFEKIRDFQIGSAPTDVLSILASGGFIAYATSKAKDKNEVVSITLTQGIPVVSAVGTSLLCTARLISGSKAMAIGLVSGKLMQELGKFIDKERQKYFQNKEN